MSEILNRKEYGDHGSLALDLSCGCTIVVPERSRVLVIGNEFVCYKCDLDAPEMFANWPRDNKARNAE